MRITLTLALAAYLVASTISIVLGLIIALIFWIGVGIYIWIQK